MKALVITLEGNPKSVQIAERCIKSGRKYGIEINRFSACDASKVDAKEIFAANNLPTRNFVDQWSRPDRAMACFFSHFSIWALAEQTHQPILVLEHDAVFESNIDLNTLALDGFLERGIVNIGKPSYGKYVNRPKSGATGVVPFFSNPRGYLKGAHAYIVTPEGARDLIKTAYEKASPADLFINPIDFPNLKEYYPWPVVVKEKFSTVQKPKGCLAKHNYSDQYQVI